MGSDSCNNPNLRQYRVGFDTGEKEARSKRRTGDPTILKRELCGKTSHLTHPCAVHDPAHGGLKLKW